MANVIIKEEQRFRDPLSYGVLGVLLLTTVFVFAQDTLLHSSPVQLPGWFYTLSLLLLVGVLWYFMHLRFKLSITEKGIKFRFEPFVARKRRISWDEIESYEFVETHWLAGLSGGNVNFSSLENLYSLCGRNGLMVHTKAGETIFLGSRSLLARREEIERYMNQYLSRVK